MWKNIDEGDNYTISTRPFVVVNEQDQEKTVATYKIETFVHGVTLEFLHDDVLTLESYSCVDESSKTKNNVTTTKRMLYRMFKMPTLFEDRVIAINQEVTYVKHLRMVVNAYQFSQKVLDLIPKKVLEEDKARGRRQSRRLTKGMRKTTDEPNDTSKEKVTDEQNDMSKEKVRDEQNAMSKEKVTDEQNNMSKEKDTDTNAGSRLTSTIGGIGKTLGSLGGPSNAKYIAVKVEIGGMIFERVSANRIKCSYTFRLNAGSLVPESLTGTICTAELQRWVGRLQKQCAEERTRLTADAPAASSLIRKVSRMVLGEPS